MQIQAWKLLITVDDSSAPSSKSTPDVSNELGHVAAALPLTHALSFGDTI